MLCGFAYLFDIAEYPLQGWDSVFTFNHGSDETKSIQDFGIELPDGVGNVGDVVAPMLCVCLKGDVGKVDLLYPACRYLIDIIDGTEALINTAGK